MGIVTVGIDTAKSVFAVHGADEAGKVQLRQPKAARGKLNALMAELPPCTIGIEALTGAHYWARQLQAHGNTVKLMAAKLVEPHRMSGKRGKNDAADAAAVCEAASPANMRFVPAKTEDQQARLMVHRECFAAGSPHAALATLDARAVDPKAIDDVELARSRALRLRIP